MDALSTAKVAAAGIAGAGGSGGAVYGTYYLVTSNKSSSKREQSEEVKEAKPKFKELEKWTKDHKCTIVSVENKKQSPNKTINFADLDETMSNDLLTWVQKDSNKTTVMQCTSDENTATAINVKLETSDWKTFTKKTDAAGG